MTRREKKKNSIERGSGNNNDNDVDDDDEDPVYHDPFDDEDDFRAAGVARLPSNQMKLSPKKKKKKFVGNSKSSHHRSTGNSRSHHRHRRHHQGESSSSKPSAAAAIGHPEAPEIEHFRAILSGDGDHPEMESKKATILLEATAGNIQLAAQLFWDDHFASQAASSLAAVDPSSQNHADKPDKKLPAARNAHHESADSDDENDDEDTHSHTSGNGRHRHPKIRRSLDKDFGRAAEDKEEEPEFELEEEMEEAGDENQQNQRMADAIADQQVRLQDMVGSVSVSDDEAGGGVAWSIASKGPTKSRKNNRRQKDDGLERRIREAAAAVAKKVSPKFEFDDDEERRKKRKRTEDEIEDDDYISDSDWLEEERNTIKDPFQALWGKGTWGKGTSAESSSSSVTADNENAGEGNLVADEDTEEQKDDTTLGISRTWLNASFSLTSCGKGLALKPPKPEDIEFFAWRQQQNQERSSRPGVPPPHHCKAITAVISIINAMILTGASIQGQEVNCTSAKKPFAQLTLAERKREFEMRLTDAIAALIFIAAKASTNRKRRAISRAKRLLGEENEIKTQKMQRRLYLIPTCTWEAPDGPSHRNVQVTTSLTNINDIRLYVLSSIRAFTAPGGVALLLETILRIHGSGVISRMMVRAKETVKDASTEETLSSLICCTCEERQREELKKNPNPLSARNDPAKIIDATPPGHECISMELISLLMTGRVESSWKGWSNKGLDFGILANSPGRMGWQLARPEKPVWILQGETCYSVLYLTGCKEADLKTISKVDTSGAVLEFVHWNCWYGQRNESSFRLITAAGKWNPPGLSFKPSADKWQGCRPPMKSRFTLDLLKERLGFDRRTNKMSASEHELMEAKEKASPITAKELEAVTAHPDDVRFYPGKHNMWRFDMGEVDKENLEVWERKVSAETWVPYHRLPKRQKLIVELKLGLKIRCILWTRWPSSIIDSFTPPGEDPPIV
jgi:hypothetical protein